MHTSVPVPDDKDQTEMKRLREVIMESEGRIVEKVADHLRSHGIPVITRTSSIQHPMTSSESAHEALDSMPGIKREPKWKPNDPSEWTHGDHLIHHSRHEPRTLYVQKKIGDRVKDKSGTHDFEYTIVHGDDDDDRDVDGVEGVKKHVADLNAAGHHAHVHRLDEHEADIRGTTSHPSGFHDHMHAMGFEDIDNADEFDADDDDADADEFDADDDDADRGDPDGRYYSLTKREKRVAGVAERDASSDA